jgi:hypothetical protein
VSSSEADLEDQAGQLEDHDYDTDAWRPPAIPSLAFNGHRSPLRVKGFAGRIRFRFKANSTKGQVEQRSSVIGNRACMRMRGTGVASTVQPCTVDVSTSE